MKIRLKVREIAEQKGFNQSSLSRTANIDFKTVKRLFRDPYRDVALSTIVKIAWALDISVADLIEVSEMPTKWEASPPENI
jgi:DNA-binding Xre family transcriptional regulator